MELAVVEAESPLKDTDKVLVGTVVARGVDTDETLAGVVSREADEDTFKTEDSEGKEVDDGADTLNIDDPIVVDDANVSVISIEDGLSTSQSFCTQFSM